MDRLARRLIARGHTVLRVNISFGDRIFWHLPGAMNYRGRLEDWAAFIGTVYDRHRVTDIVLLGDCRPHHVAAMKEARQRGIRVTVTELGYLRPDWVTLERDGMTSFSHFPRDPEAIRALAARLPEPDLTVRYRSSFVRMVLWDIAYNLANVFLSPLFYPHYRWHAIWHPLHEYAGWLRKWLLAPLAILRTRRALSALEAAGDPFFVFPLQLETDYQIRVHSPFSSMKEAIRYIVDSFARHAPRQSRLVVKVHPLDNGLVNWRRIVGEAAAQRTCAERVIYVDGGDLDRLLARSCGCVTINSTVGITALRLDCPVIALGNAVFDVPGLTFQGPLDAFWAASERPDPELRDAFLRALAGAIQVKGGYYDYEAIEAAAETAAERLSGAMIELPPIAPQDRDKVQHRRAG